MHFDNFYIFIGGLSFFTINVYTMHWPVDLENIDLNKDIQLNNALPDQKNTEEITNPKKRKRSRNSTLHGMPTEEYFAWFNKNEQPKISKNKQQRELACIKNYIHETYNIRLSDSRVKYFIKYANWFVKIPPKKQLFGPLNKKEHEFLFIQKVSKQYDLSINQAFDILAITKQLLK